MRQPDFSPSSVLLVDDEPQILLSSSITLRKADIKEVTTIEDSREVLPLLRSKPFGVVVLDLFMPHKSGLQLLSEIMHDYPQTQVLMMTAGNRIETAIECMKLGAFDYLLKPVDEQRFVTSVKQALEVHALSYEVSSLKEHLLTDTLMHEDAFSALVTQNKKMRAIFQYVETIAKTSQPVLIVGETGVGKELIANAVHMLSGKRGSFVAVNIGGVDDTMLSDTLFGHKKGAFSGADSVRDGLITKAAGGTLFLDEIGDLSEASQMKLLRLLQEREYYPLGADVPKHSDARVVVATNCDLDDLIAKGRFRKDLYYRLRAHQIQIPPLRERIDDIPLLVKHFLESAAKELHKNIPSYPPELITLLSLYEFPGNIRELEAMVFDAVARHHSGILSLESFKEIIVLEHPHPAGSHADALMFPKGLPTLRQAEELLVQEALKRAKGNQGMAASLLGITRQALNKRLNKNNN